MWVKIKAFLTKDQWGIPMWALLAAAGALLYFFLPKKKRYGRR